MKVYVVIQIPRFSDDQIAGEPEILHVFWEEQRAIEACKGDFEIDYCECEVE